MDIDYLTQKLNRLRDELHRLETAEAEKIRDKRERNDMGDDFRENEGAKLIMEDHNLFFLRINSLKREIYSLKKRIIQSRTSDQHHPLKTRNE